MLVRSTPGVGKADLTSNKGPSALVVVQCPQKLREVNR